MRSIRIGGGAGFAGDSIEPALVLLEKGKLDYIGFECLAERTIAMAMQQKNLDPNKGYNASLERRMKKVLPLAAKNKVKVITNMGAANVEKAVEKTAEIARELGITGLKIMGVLGDDVFGCLDKYESAAVMEFPKSLGQVKNKTAANAYIGCEPIVEALRQGADVVITGRCADPALFLAPLVYEFGWSMEDYEKLGTGTLVGHLMECSVQVSGGNFAIPGNKEVERLWEIGYPYADVSEDGTVCISKVEGTGGRIDTHTCTEQLLYEIHDPESYLTPDCVADFSNVAFEMAGDNCVKAFGATGKPPTGTYKVSVGYKDGYIGSASLSYGGPFCFERALLAKETLEHIIAANYETEELKIDLVGYNSLFPRDVKSGFPGESGPLEVRVRVAARAKEKETLEAIADEVDTLTISGPANGGGMERNIKELVAACSFLIPKEDIEISYVVKAV